MRCFSANIGFSEELDDLTMKNSAPLRILIVSDHTYLPDRCGGRESSIHELASRLTEMDNLVTVVANRGSSRDLLKVFFKRMTWRHKYRVLRVKNEKLTSLKLLLKKQFDIAIYNVLRVGDYVALSKEISSRQIFYIRDAEDVSLGCSELFTYTHFVANSQFIARLVESRTGKQPFVFTPLIDLSQYATSTTRENITFINPVPVKGVDTAISLAAACKDSNFLFIEGWPLTMKERSNLKVKLSQHKNIQLAGQMSVKNDIYSTTKVLLVPSRWEEGFGRVVLEAQISGIPVLATEIGGLPEAVGQGGVLIPPEAGIDAWLEALTLMINSPRYYSLLSDLAKKNAIAYHRTSEKTLVDFLTLLKTIAYQSQ